MSMRSGDLTTISPGSKSGARAAMQPSTSARTRSSPTRSAAPGGDWLTSARNRIRSTRSEPWSRFCSGAVSSNTRRTLVCGRNWGFPARSRRCRQVRRQSGRLRLSSAGGATRLASGLGCCSPASIRRTCLRSRRGGSPPRSSTRTRDTRARGSERRAARRVSPTSRSPGGT